MVNRSILVCACAFVIAEMGKIGAAIYVVASLFANRTCSIAKFAAVTVQQYWGA